ncbi:MAG: hypothetical protein MI785_04420 [Kiloniellales bacterium]|nr:hypothetical protein [Kiloniellales bacterium]
MSDKSSEISSASLRLSAQRAFLGRIDPSVRLIKIKSIGDEIHLSVVLRGSPSDETSESISDASAEIGSDFPDSTVLENIEVSAEEIPVENIIENGWVYRSTD